MVIVPKELLTIKIHHNTLPGFYSQSRSGRHSKWRHLAAWPLVHLDLSWAPPPLRAPRIRCRLWRPCFYKKKEREREKEDGCHYISIYQGILRTVRGRWPAEIFRYLSPSPCAIAAAGPSDSAARHLPRSFPHCSLWMTDTTSCAREVDPSNGKLICHNNDNNNNKERWKRINFLTMCVWWRSASEICRLKY